VLSNAKKEKDVLPSRPYPVPPWQRADKTTAKAIHDSGKRLLSPIYLFIKNSPNANAEIHHFN